MKKETLYFFLVIFLFHSIDIKAQKCPDLLAYSKDTLVILLEFGMNLTCYKKVNYDFLSSNHNPPNDSTKYHNTGFFILQDSSKEEFSVDGCQLSYYTHQSSIDKLVNCKWIEIRSIILKERFILLDLIVRKKENSIVTETKCYTYKIKIKYEKLRGGHEYCYPLYKLKKKYNCI